MGDGSGKPKGAGEKPSVSAPGDVWHRLETFFPDPIRLFKPHTLPSLSSKDLIVVLDSSCLLLPYNLNRQVAGSIGDLYKKLIAQKRLFVPARAAREFAANRDENLSKIIEHLNDCRSLINFKLPDAPILAELEAFKEIRESVETFTKTKKAFSKAVDTIIDEIESWRGDDPISLLYAKLFNADTIADFEAVPQEKLRAEWETRLKLKRPPGYADQQKLDGGIGDFLIWKTILAVGAAKKLPVAFVSYDRKPDWAVRGKYIRPELVDEFREASGGHDIQLCTLAELLKALDAPKTVIDDVKSAEPSILEKLLSKDYVNEVAKWVNQSAIRTISFDYSTKNGIVTAVGEGTSFDLRFSRHSDTGIYLYTGLTNLIRIARIKASEGDGPFHISQFDTSSDVYTINVGDGFIAENRDGALLAGRLDGVEDESRGAPADQVVFRYLVYPSSDIFKLPPAGILSAVLARGR